MKESNTYKTYYDLATGKVILKPKYVRRSTGENTDQAPKASPGKRLKAIAKVTKSGKKKLPAQRLETLSEIALDDENDDEVSENADNEDDDDHDDDNANTKDDDEERHKEKLDEEDKGFDQRFHTPSHFESTNDEAYDKVTQEKINEEEEVNELYSDMNINLEGRDTKIIDALLANVQATQVIKDTHVIMTVVTPKVQQRSSSVSSGFISKMLNLNPDTCIDSILNLNNKSTYLVYVPVTTNDEIPPSSVTTLPLPPIPLIQLMQQTYVSTQTISPISSIFGIVDKYLANQMNEVVKAAVHLQLNKLREEAKAENEDFINIIDENIKKISRIKSKYKLRSKSPRFCRELKNAYEIDKVILETYGDIFTFKRRQDDEVEDEEPFDESNWGRREEDPERNLSQLVHERRRLLSQSTRLKKGPSLKQAKPPTPNCYWNKMLPTIHRPIQPWIGTLAQNEDPRELFNKLMDSPLDFSAFMLNRLKVDTLTPELLASLTFELMKGSCKSLVELEYFLDEVCKATTNQLDWNNPKGQQYPHDLRKPLPLIPNSQGRRVIPFNHFINNDLAYLSGGVSSRTYTTSVTKTKAAYYGHLKWIKDLVLNTMWINRESTRDVYSRNRIISIKKLTIVEWHNYNHLEWITVRRDDDKLYTFKEGDYNGLRLKDVEDMLLLLI
uniref:Uncharacterized protein n=1 Tax=Tanacetum cinerariifolium TaxID=118510 RepID=A0A6L2JK76_TANCI|nr:hypothetical protein [Tanacetum cinerariifolium]